MDHLFSDKKLRKEFIFVLFITIWLLSFLLAAGSYLSRAGDLGTDLYYYFHLQNPEGGQLAYPLFALLYLKALAAITADIAVFRVVFFLLSILWFLLLISIFSRLIPDRQELLKCSLLFAPLLYLALAKVEIVCITLAVLSLFFFARGNRWQGWAVLTLAMYFKLFPVFLIPLFLCMELFSSDRDLKRPVFFLIVMALLLMVNENLISIMYQSARDIELDSIYANALLLVERFHDIGVKVVYGYGSWNVILPQSLEFLIPASTAFQLLAAAAVSLAFFMDKRRDGRVWQYAFLMFTIAPLTGKLFSTQFVLWPIAFSIPILGNPRFRWLFYPMLLIAVLSFMFFDLFYELLLGGSAALFLLTIRNLGLVSVVIYTVVSIRKPDPLSVAK